MEIQDNTSKTLDFLLLTFSNPEEKSIISTISQNKTKIETLVIDIQDHEISEDLSKISEILPPPKKIIFHGKKSKIFQKISKKINNSELLIRDFSVDISRKWTDFKHFGFKYYIVSRWIANGINHEHIKARIGMDLCHLSALISENPSKNSYWIPGFQVENLENKFKILKGNFEVFPNYSLKKIPVNSEKSVFVKIKNCGISIKYAAPDFQENENCDLEWMCPKCWKSTPETDYFYKKLTDLITD